MGALTEQSVSVKLRWKLGKTEIMRSRIWKKISESIRDTWLTIERPVRSKIKKIFIALFGLKGLIDQEFFPSKP